MEFGQIDINNNCSYPCYQCNKNTLTKIYHKCYNKNCKGTGLCPVNYVCKICGTNKNL